MPSYGASLGAHLMHTNIATGGAHAFAYTHRTY
jgi:hypothetical protein